MSYLDALGAVPSPNFEASDRGDRYGNQNDGITPIFFMMPVENPDKTAKEGRPIFDEVECLRIFVAGDQYNQVVSPVMDEHRERFPEQYERWKSKHTNGEHVSGTPLRSWPLISSLQLAEFEAMKIFNVEGLASIAESNMQRSPSLREWKTKAAAWLLTAKDGAAAVKFAAENEQLRSEMDDMRKQIADLASRIPPEDGQRRRKDAA